METRKKKASLKNPTTAYQCCPECSSKSLIRMNVDVLCADCDWMSCEAYVESGGMDNIFAAYRDHFGINAEDEQGADVEIQESEQCAVEASA